MWISLILLIFSEFGCNYSGPTHFFAPQEHCSKLNSLHWLFSHPSQPSPAPGGWILFNSSPMHWQSLPLWCSLPFLKTSSVHLSSVSSVAQLSPTLCHPMDCGRPGLPVHHQLLEFTQIHVHWVGDAIQPSHPLSFPSPPVFNLSQHPGLFQWVSFSHQVAKILELQLLHQSFQCISRTDLL